MVNFYYLIHAFVGGRIVTNYFQQLAVLYQEKLETSQNNINK